MSYAIGDYESACYDMDEPPECSYYCCGICFLVVFADFFAHCFTPNPPNLFQYNVSFFDIILN